MLYNLLLIYKGDFKMKKRSFERIFSVAIVLALFSSLFICPQTTATILSGNNSLAYDVASEGIVLLKNENNALPLEYGEEKIALFGNGQIYNGTVTAGFQTAGDGSAEDAPSYVIDPSDAFLKLDTEGKVDLYNDLTSKYQEDIAYIPDDAMYTAAGENADTAIVFITRNPSATGDRTEADWNLTDNEKNMLKKLSVMKNNGTIEKIVVVLNTGSTIDTSWAKNNNQDEINVDAVLAAWYPGEQGGNAIADILMGYTNPSGKLSDTFVNKLSDYPAGLDDKYIEDIFVGYRYFETFGVDVSYPFGYGLSYTTFEFGTPEYIVDENEITVNVEVTNTGSVPGKEVVQVYYSAPQIGEVGALLSKASVELVGFNKTKLIEPGETEKVSIKFNVNDMASYDDEGITGRKSAYVLEAGDYDIYVGNSVKDAQTRLAGTYKVNSLTVTEQLKQYLVPNSSFNRIVALNNNGTISKGEKAVITGNDAAVENRDYNHFNGVTDNNIILFNDVLTGKASYEQFVSQMSIDELISFSVGHPRTSSSNGSSKAVIGGEEAVNKKYGIPAADTFNGPCGINISTNATSFGSEVLMACTWNKELIYEMGTGMGKEAVISGADILLTPSLNIHRHPLNGRHFEYYSEDPVLTGEMAVAETNGIISQGVTVTLKHLAIYNKRYPQAQNNILSERAAREIYLKGFEIAVKNLPKDKPYGVMSSYNKINGKYASEIKGLMTGILRNEWGFNGFVLSDWGAAGDASLSLIAGNNIKVPTSSTPSNTTSNTQRQDYINDVKSAYNSGEITREALELNAIDILRVLAELPDSYINLIPTSRIYASTCYADNDMKPKIVSNLYDNDNETDWAGLEESKTTNRLIVDLGKATSIRLVEFVSARMSNFRKPFSIYLSNDGECINKELLYEYNGGNQGVTYSIVPATVDSITSDKYRYLIIDGKNLDEKIGLAELRVFSNLNEANTTDNSLINISDLTNKKRISTSTAYSGWSGTRAVDMSTSSEFITAQSHYQKDEYFYIDLVKAKKIDSLSLLIGTSSGIGSTATPADLRTDFDIVARNDNNFSSLTDETVLIDYTGTLGPDTGDSSGFCVLEIPEKFKDKEFRYVGIRKKPTTANNSVGQICINELGIFSKTSDYNNSFDTLEAVYNKEIGAITVSTVARTVENRPYKFVIAGYDENDVIVEVKVAELKRPEETLRSERGIEIQGIGYASNISKSLVFENHLEIDHAKIMLLNDYENMTPITDYEIIDVNPEVKVQLLYDKVIEYMTEDFDVAVPPKNRPLITKQLDVVIDWPAVSGANEYTYTLSLNSDFSNGKEYKTNTNSVTLNNLYVAEEYFWKAVSDNGIQATGSFKTQDYTPRFITTDSVDNVRDLGGWMTESGKRVKQGLIYRGATLSDDVTSDSSNYLLNGGTVLSDNDKDVFVNDLGMKSDIDLRGSGEKNGRTESPLGSSVTYYDLTILADDRIFTTTKDAVADVFKVMADEKNYPIYFHCTGGCDRTGRIAYLVNGLLGVSKEDLIRDWELSSFSYSMRYRGDGYWTGFEAFIKMVDNYDGNTLSEKIENLMINTLGLTKTEVANIKNIMLYN